jgi:hypothetical protein
MYKHHHIDVYKVVIELIDFICDYLEISYSNIFQHLRRVL